MNRLVICLLCLVGMVVSVTASGVPENFSLGKCLRMGIERNASMVRAGIEKLASEEKVSEALSHGLPQIEGSVQSLDYLQKSVMLLPGDLMGAPGTNIAMEIGTKYNTTAALKVNQLLYSQTYFLSLSVSRKLTEVSDMKIEKAKSDVIYDITKLYILASVTRRQIDLIETNISRLDSIIGITKVQVENGYAKSVDLDRAVVSKSNLQVQLESTNALYKQQLCMIKYFIDSQQEFVITDSVPTLLAGTEIGADATQILQRKEISLLQLQKDLYNDNLSAVKYEYIPTVSLIGQFQYQNMRDDFKLLGERWFGTAYIGLNISIPIFDGFNKKSRINQAKLDLMMCETDLADTKKYFETNLENAKRDYSKNIDAMAKQAENVVLAEKILAVSRVKFSEGSVSMSDLLTDETSLCNAEQNYLNTKMQVLNTELELLKSIGKLEILLNK